MTSLPSVVGIGTPEDKGPLHQISGMSITISGHMVPDGFSLARGPLPGICHCDPFWKFHSKDCGKWPGQEVLMVSRKIAAEKFITDVGLTPTPDAIDQLAEVFVPCLEIMCRRGWDPNGGTWRRAGILGILCDVRKKFERLWERGWVNGKRHPDSGFDLINFVGMYLRSDENGWGGWGSPATRDDVHEDAP